MQPHPTHREGRSMNHNELSSHNVFEWAKKEFLGDPEYWQDRAKNGTGLIQQIAHFVLRCGQAGAKL